MANSIEAIYTMSRSDYHAWATKVNRNSQALPSLFLSNSIPTQETVHRLCDDAATKPTILPPKESHITLPAELMFEILSYLLDYGEQRSLYNASLVNRHWLNCVTPLLFRHPKIHNTYRWATFLLTLIRPKQQYTFGEFVRSINLSSSYEFSVENCENSNHEQVDTAVAGGLMDVLENGADHWENVEVSNVDVSNSKVTPTITLSTSSFLQVASRCPNLTFLELSNTALFCDSLILETGEYLSSIQTFALQPGLTHVRIDLDQAIRTLGTQCPSLTQINMQACDWVTAKVIWCWTSNCPKLQKLDARRCLRCGIERLTSAALDITGWEQERDLFSLFPKQNDDGWSNSNHYSRNEDNRTSSEDDEEVSWMTNSQLAEYSVPTPSVFAGDRRHTSNENRTVQSNTLMRNTPSQNSTSQAIPSHLNKQSTPITLRSLVYSILKEAKDSGISDINWLHDELA